MIKLETSKLIAQLELLKKQIEVKLENMVREFSYHITEQAVMNTPLGDSTTNWDWYLKRIEDKGWQSYGLLPEEGFAQGSWQVITSRGAVSLKLVENYGNNSWQAALSTAKSSLAGYKLGNQVIIGNKGPYIRNLENGYSDQAPDGIVKPTLQMVQAVFATELKVYYDKGMI